MTEDEKEIRDTITNLQQLFERNDLNVLHSLGGVEGLAAKFETDLKNGISSDLLVEELERRRTIWGPNSLPEQKQKTWCFHFIASFQNIMIKMLCFLSLGSFILTIAIDRSGDWIHYIDPLALLIAVIIVSWVTAQTNYSQSKQFAKLSEAKNSFNMTVIRQGTEQSIISTEIVVGDLISFRSGDAVPVDCLFISGHSFKLNMSQITGESVPVVVNSNKPVIQSGSAVDSGDAVALVCAVGVNSQFGVVLNNIQMMSEVNEQTPLQQKLTILAKQVTALGGIGSGLTFVVLLIVWIVNLVKNGWKKEMLTTLMDALMISITIFVGAIPEGLPLAVVISLGFSMKRMMKENNFVRHLAACETMGGATTICSDKTGTLTQNKMTVVSYYQDHQDHQISSDLSEKVREALSLSISVNSTAYEINGEYVGPATECALLKYVDILGYDYKKVRERYPVIIRHDFNSTRKRMSSIVNVDGTPFVCCKGAPELLMRQCTHYMKLDGSIAELNEEMRHDYLVRIDELADDALRTIMIAFSEISEADGNWEIDYNVERHLILIGICGIRDPLRPEVPQAIQDCSRAGVMVRMVTGDNLNTAISIAAQCGILTDQGIWLTGAQFSATSKTDLLQSLPQLQVLARSSPLDKLRLVGLLMESGEVVAVTGDGSNDSPALKKANVGLSMGKCGTELAKMASDIVILDDNFVSIVNALKWGRCIYDNVRSFLQFQLTVNFAAMIISFVGSCVLKRSPLKAIQLLWISLIMDSIGALALASKGPFDSLLDRPPYGESGALIAPLLIRNIAVHSVFQIIIILIVLFAEEVLFGITTDVLETTFIFNVFVFFQIFNLFNARVADESQSFTEGLFDNWVYWFFFFAMIVVQVVLVEWGGDLFGTCGLNWKLWLWSIGLALTEFIVGFITRKFSIKDSTTKRLVEHRELRREEIRRRYSRMTVSAMWRVSDGAGGGTPQAPSAGQAVRRDSILVKRKHRSSSPSNSD